MKTPCLLDAGIRRLLFDAVGGAMGQLGGAVEGLRIETTTDPVTQKRRCTIRFNFTPNELLWPTSFVETP